jgi:hypothetical protein
MAAHPAGFRVGSRLVRRASFNSVEVLSLERADAPAGVNFALGVASRTSDDIL